MTYQMQFKTKVSISHPKIPTALDWQKGSSIKVNHATSKERPAADKPKVVLSGETTRENITTEAMVKTVRDADFLALCLAGEKFAGATITYQDIDNANLPVGRPRVITGCSAESVEIPGGDATSEESSKVVIEWTLP